MLPQRFSKRPAAASVSGTRVSRYALVRRCMGNYLSPILVDSILTRATDTCKVSPSRSSDELLPAIVEESINGLRLFVEPGRLPELISRLRLLAAPDR
jgi:hypothetical protein